MTDTKLYCSWFCPFAQRAWIALNHKKIPFQYVEQDPYDKTPEWLAISPKGLIPCIVNEGRTIYESSVCVEFIDEYWAEGKSLLPEDPYARAVVRIWSDHISKKIVPHFYALLLKRTTEEREIAKQGLLDGIKKFQDAIHKDGPYFMGVDFGMVDIMLAPHAQRLSRGNVTDHYRNFSVPDTHEYEKFHEWWRCVQRVEAYKQTVQPVERLLERYKGYAEDTYQSQVAEAVRRGKALP